MTPKVKNRIVFWTRMTGWVGTGCVAPIAVFASKFGLFKQSGYKVTTDELGNITEVTATALNGWGIICCLIVLWTAVQLLNELKDAFVGYSLPKQCIDGFLKLMPLITMLVVCYFLRTSLDNIIYCLTSIIIARACAVPLNPLPKWKYEVKGVENYDDALTQIVKYLKSKGGKP